MDGKRKFYMFFGQLVAASVLMAFGKLSGAEFVSLQTLAIPVFVAGNVGEHYVDAGEKNPPKEADNAKAADLR